MSLLLRLLDEASNELGLPATACRQCHRDLHVLGVWWCRLNSNLEPMPLTVSYDNDSSVGAAGDVTQCAVRKTPQPFVGFFEHLGAQPTMPSATRR